MEVRSGLYLAAAVALVLLMLAASSFYVSRSDNGGTNASHTNSTQQAEPVAGSSLICPKGSNIRLINQSAFCTIDVSSDFVTLNPGYSYFSNHSIAFMGVRFATYCPSQFRGCPGSSNNSTIVYAAALKVTLTFSNGDNETVGEVIGPANSIMMLSNYTHPRAGVELVWTGRAYNATLIVESATQPA